MIRYEEYNDFVCWMFICSQKVCVQTPKVVIYDKYRQVFKMDKMTRKSIVTQSIFPKTSGASHLFIELFYVLSMSYLQ